MSSPELSKMDKVPKGEYFEIWPIPFQNYDTINAHLDNTAKISVALQTTSPLYSVVYPIYHLTSWYVWGKKGDGEWRLWMMGI